MQVQLLARGGPDGPHAVHAARLVPAVAGGQHAADGGIVDCPSTGSCNTQHSPARMGTVAFASPQPRGKSLWNLLLVLLCSVCTYLYSEICIYTHIQTQNLNFLSLCCLMRGQILLALPAYL